MGRRINVESSEFYCTKCGKRNYDIYRRKGREREAGHLKKLWCFNCKEEHNCVECKPWTKYDYNDFLLEYNNNNFDEDGNRVMTYGELRAKLNKEGRLYEE